MKINLEYPFINYTHGYITLNGDGRKKVVLSNHGLGLKKTISYARYLLSVKEGRILERWEQADHINENPTDDSLENLQILTVAENNRKSREFRGIKTTSYIFICPICNKEFVLSASRSHKINPACSRTCGYIKMAQTQKLSGKGRNRECGTYAMYQHGCKCVKCKKANCDYGKTLKQKRAKRTVAG